MERRDLAPRATLSRPAASAVDSPKAGRIWIINRPGVVSPSLVSYTKRHNYPGLFISARRRLILGAGLKTKLQVLRVRSCSPSDTQSLIMH